MALRAYGFRADDHIDGRGADIEFQWLRDFAGLKFTDGGDDGLVQVLEVAPTGVAAFAGEVVRADAFGHVGWPAMGLPPIL